MTALPEDAALSPPPAPFGPPLRPTLRLRWGLLLEVDGQGELVLVWEPGPEDLRFGYDLLMSVEGFRQALGAMFVAWRG